MKKIVLTIVVIALVGIILCACGKVTTPQEESHISYLQTTYYYGHNANFAVRLVGGESEELFVADGKTMDVAHFDTLSLVPQHVDLFNESYTYTLVGTTGEITGNLQKDSFGASYTADIAAIDSIGTPTEVRIAGESVQETIALTDMLQDAITGTKAMEIAQQALQAKLEADDKEREIYIKYINDVGNDQSPYYWYVAYIAAPTDYYSVLVDDQGNVVNVNP